MLHRAAIPTVPTAAWKAAALYGGNHQGLAEEAGGAFPHLHSHYYWEWIEEKK